MNNIIQKLLAANIIYRYCDNKYKIYGDYMIKYGSAIVIAFTDDLIIHEYDEISIDGSNESTVWENLLVFKTFYIE